jgi:hypothetical protein
MNQAMGGGKTENNDDDGDGIGNEPAKKKTKAQLLKAFDESFGLVKDRRGHTPLHYAAFENNLEVGSLPHVQISALPLIAFLGYSRVSLGESRHGGVGSGEEHAVACCMFGRALGHCQVSSRRMSSQP